MKLQYLVVIFVAIMLPIVLVLAQYVGVQVDTISAKTKYDTALLGATFDTMSAYELNTRNVSNSSVVGADIREIEAVISTFTRSLSSSLGLTGVANDYILSYIPAIAFCMYDGYYIYMPNDTNPGSEKLQPYVYYTKTYENGADTRITIAYSLDNYVTIYGTYKEAGGATKTISAAGYLIVPEDVTISNFSYVSSVKTKEGRIAEENEITDGEVGNIEYKVLSGSIKYMRKRTKKDENGNKIETTSPPVYIEKEVLYENKTSDDSKEIYKDKSEVSTEAMLYYYQAKEFTELYNNIIRKLKLEDQENLLISPSNDPDDEESDFMNEKVNVIKDSLNANLNRAICNFKGVNESSYEMPQLTTSDWIKITNDVSIVAFMQDIPLGNVTTYNNYVVVNSTITKKFTNAKAIDFIGYNINENSINSKGYYHKVTCLDLLREINDGSVNKIIGYPSADFERFKAAAKEENDYYYYYKHNEFADYDCEVGSIEKVNIATIDEYLKNAEISPVTRETVLKAYFEAVGRIRFRLNKASSYINLYNDTTKNFTVVYNLKDSATGATGTWDFSTVDSNNILWKSENWKDKDYTMDIGNSNSNKTIFQTRYQRIEIRSEIPYAVGYKFIGWKVKGANSTGQWAKPGDIIYCDKNNTVTLEAQYGKQYTITYIDDANKTLNPPQTTTTTKIEKINLEINHGVPEHVGMRFSGWRIVSIKDINGNKVDKVSITTKSMGKTQYQAGSQVISYDDIIAGAIIEDDVAIEFEAVYNETNYNITYVDEDGTTNKMSLVGDNIPRQVQEGKNIINLPGATKTGYTFKNWIYNGQTYEKGGTIPANLIHSDVKLIAKWNKITYTVHFDLNGGEIKTASVNYVETRDGKLQYKDREIVEGHFMSGRGLSPSPDPERTDYGFDGWYTYDLSGNEGNPFDGTYSKFNTDIINKWFGNNTEITLHAKWNVDTWQVAYDSNIEQTVNNMPTSTTGRKQENKYVLNVPNQKPTTKDYTFLYWTTDKEGKGERYYANTTKDFGSIKPANRTVYAQWARTTVAVIYRNDWNNTEARENITFTVNERTNGETYGGTQYYTWIPAENNPLKAEIGKQKDKFKETDGQYVTAWLDNKTNKIVHAGDKILVEYINKDKTRVTTYENGKAVETEYNNNENIILYAFWNTKDYETDVTVEFNKNTTDVVTGIPAPMKRTATSGVLRIPNQIPVRAGYEFVGWCKNYKALPTTTTDKIYKVNDPITGVDSSLMTLYAIWKKK